MYIICPGCGTTCKRSGISHHIRQSKDPRCHLPDIFRQPENLEDNPSTMPVPGPATGMTNSDENKPEDHLRFSVDPSGDLFGDYADHDGLDFGEDDEGDQVVGNDTEGEGPEHPIDAEHEKHDDDDDDEEEEEEEEEKAAELDEAVLAEEDRLEPERPTGLPDNFEQKEPGDAPSEQARAPFRLRGGFERPLSNRPEIVEFSNRNAGTVYGRAHKNVNQDYRRAVSSADGLNIYAPFSSKLDWEVARWAKM